MESVDIYTFDTVCSGKITDDSQNGVVRAEVYQKRGKKSLYM